MGWKHKRIRTITFINTYSKYFCMGNKPRGLGSGKKLRNNRKRARLKDKNFLKRTRNLKKKSDPLAGSPQAKAIVIEKVVREPKKPSSGLRRCVKCQLVKNGKPIIAYIPGYNAVRFIEEHDEVVVEGMGGSKGGAKGDIPCIRWQVVKINDQSLRALLAGKIEKGRR